MASSVRYNINLTMWCLLRAFSIKMTVCGRGNVYVYMFHYSDVTMSLIASQIISVSIICSTVCSCAHQRKDQSSASLPGLCGGEPPVPRKRPVTRKLFPFEHVIMYSTTTQSFHILYLSYIILYSLFPFQSSSGLQCVPCYFWLLSLFL